jgi:hypothetical protein
MPTWIYHLHHSIVASVLCQVANNKLDFPRRRWLVERCVKYRIRIPHLFYVGSLLGTLICFLLAAQSNLYKSFFRTAKCHLGLSSLFYTDNHTTSTT